MRTSTRLILVIPAIIVLATWVDAAPFFGKKANHSFELTEDNGPWMIMVASFYSPDKPQDDVAVAKARELAEELDSQGWPSYLYVQESKFDAKGEVVRRDPYGEVKPAHFRDFFYVAVLAGNFESIRDNDAQHMLAKIKSYKPKCMLHESIRIPAGAPGPLWTAFLTPNPLRSAHHGPAQRKLEPFLVKLNERSEFNLLKCPAPITVTVATFNGATAYNPDALKAKNPEAYQQLMKQSWLLQAGIEAEELARALKLKGYEAYVFHDRSKSVVTVGGFQSIEDPRLLTTLKTFGAIRNKEGKPVPRTLRDPKTNKPRWVFDVQPLPVYIPRP